MATARAATLRVEGYKEFLTACDNAGKDSKKFVRAALRQSGEIVKRDATAKFGRYDARTASGYRVVVRRTGVVVEQSIRRTTGLRPDFGALQMQRALVPALTENEEATERELEKALDVICDHFDAVPAS